MRQEWVSPFGLIVRWEIMLRWGGFDGAGRLILRCAQNDKGRGVVGGVIL